MTNNKYAAKSTNDSNNRIAKKLYFVLFSIMCIAIFVVSFIAFLKIENNLHAFLVFSIGITMTVMIFINGRKP